MASDKARFRILISLVTISGFSQGMLLPLLAIILEKNGVSSSLNGLQATGLYIGVLLASPFMEKPMKRFGYKTIIMTGGVLVFLSMLIFPLWESLWFWFMLRVTIGIGDNMLHFGTQTWITTTSTKKNRGKNISYYGMFFGLGFTLGPLMTQLLVVSESLPFIVSAIFSMIVWSGMFFVRNEWPASDDKIVHQTSTFARFQKTWRIAWVALLPSFAYGFLEATLHGVFPIYGLRIGHSVDTLAIIIPLFAGGSLLTQLPLGIWSDRIGRRKVLLFVLTLGIGCFIFATQFEQSVIALLFVFLSAGMCVGSLYSLGISYMTDVIPDVLLPAGNLMVGISFSIGSISGPYLGGLFIQVFPHTSFFYLIAGMLIMVWVLILMWQPKTAAV